MRFYTAMLFVEPDPFNNRVEGLSDYFGLPHAESVGQSDENSAEQESPAVSPEEFFEIREQVFHVLPEWPGGPVRGKRVISQKKPV